MPCTTVILAPQCQAGYYCTYPWGKNCEGSRAAAGCRACSFGPRPADLSRTAEWTVDYDAQCALSEVPADAGMYFFIKNTHLLHP